MIICARQQIRNEIYFRRQQKPDFVEFQKRSLPLSRNRPAVPVISGDFNRCRNMHPGRLSEPSFRIFYVHTHCLVPPDRDRRRQVPLRLQHVRSQQHELVSPQSQSQEAQLHCLTLKNFTEQTISPLNRAVLLADIGMLKVLQE